MRTTNQRDAFVLAGACALLLGCGAAVEPDEFKGFVDASAFDTKFLAGKCGSTPCYPSQVGYVKGRAISFYNVGVVASTATVPPPVIKAANVPAVFDFTGQPCKALEYNPMRDAFDSSRQLSLFATLPLATKTAGVLVSPFVNVMPVTVGSFFNCNDVKDASDVAYKGSTALKYGLTADETSGEVRLRAVLDPTAPLAPGSTDLTLTTSLGWYKNLLLTYLDGGPVPVNDKGELVAMDGVILDPAGSTAFAKGTDQKVVLLPFAPGENGYSPIVRLHSWRLPAGKVPGDFTGICTAPNCGAKDVNYAQAATSVFNTLFIVAQ